MKVVVDTNVFVSGAFFPAGPPRKILEAWKHGQLTIMISPEILDEYKETTEKLHTRYPVIDAVAFLDLVRLKGEICVPARLVKSVCEDPDDDMFIECALASGTKTIVSGDKQLLKVSGYQNIEVLKPSIFVEQHLKRR